MRGCIVATLIIALACPLLAQEEAPKPEETEKEPPAAGEPAKEPKLAPEEIAAAIKALSSRYDEERKEARKKLISAGEQAVGPLVEHLGSELASQRAAAAEILGFAGGEAAAPALVRLVKDKDLTVREEARKALARIGPPAMKYIAEALKGQPESERKWFDLLIRKMVTAGIKSLVVLGETEYQDEYGDYPGQFEYIRKIGRNATPTLVEMAKNASNRRSYRFLAVAALGRLGDKSAVPALKEIFEKEAEMRDEAAVSLLQLGDDSCANKVIEEYRMNQIREPQEYLYPANLALFYHKLEKWEEAEAQYKRAIEISPKNTGAYYNYSCLLSVRGRLKEAMAALTKALENGWDSGSWITRDKELDNLRKLPEFKELVEKRFGKAAGAE